MAHVNGVDYTARTQALIDAGIDPRGHMSQFHEVLGVTWVYCNAHLGIHLASTTKERGGCTVGVRDMFPLFYDVEPTYEGQRQVGDLARVEGFRLHLDPVPCTGCGKDVKFSGHEWKSVDDATTACAGGGIHTPEQRSIPEARVATL